MHWMFISQKANPIVDELSELVRSARSGCEVTFLGRPAESKERILGRPATHILAVIENELELDTLIEQRTWLDGKPLVLVLSGGGFSSRAYELAPRFLARYPEDSAVLKDVILRLIRQECHYQERLMEARREM
jgi:hypothetical protein